MFFGLCSGLGGCSSWTSGGFKDPEVRLVKVDVIKAKLLEQQFKLRFRIDNPNPVSLPVRGLDYSVYLNEVKLAEGRDLSSDTAIEMILERFGDQAKTAEEAASLAPAPQH